MKMTPLKSYNSGHVLKQLYDHRFESTRIIGKGAYG